MRCDRCCAQSLNDEGESGDVNLWQVRGCLEKLPSNEIELTLGCLKPLELDELITQASNQALPKVGAPPVWLEATRN